MLIEITQAQVDLLTGIQLDLGLENEEQALSAAILMLDTARSPVPMSFMLNDSVFHISRQPVQKLVL